MVDRTGFGNVFKQMFGAWNNRFKTHLLSHLGLVEHADERQSGPSLVKGRARLS